MPDEIKQCGRCEEEYEGYGYGVTDDFTALVDDVSAKKEWGNLCPDCRRETCDGWFMM